MLGYYVSPMGILISFAYQHYIFEAPNEICYVGSSISLYARVTSYFMPSILAKAFSSNHPTLRQKGLVIKEKVVNF
jgi:hypothetical protein